jgi:hypothetical protein
MNACVGGRRIWLAQILLSENSAQAKAHGYRTTATLPVLTLGEILE